MILLTLLSVNIIKYCKLKWTHSFMYMYKPCLICIGRENIKCVVSVFVCVCGYVHVCEHVHVSVKNRKWCANNLLFSYFVKVHIVQFVEFFAFFRIRWHFFPIASLDFSSVSLMSGTFPWYIRTTISSISAIRSSLSTFSFPWSPVKELSPSVFSSKKTSEQGELPASQHY